MLIGLATLLVVIFVKPKRGCITTLNAKCSRVYWPAGCHNCLPKRKYRYWGMTLNLLLQTRNAATGTDLFLFTSGNAFLLEVNIGQVLKLEYG